MTLSVDDRRAAGRAWRETVPLAEHAEHGPLPSTRDPIAFLEDQAASRFDDLVAVRYSSDWAQASTS
jgi:hypothetical protein